MDLHGQVLAAAVTCSYAEFGLLQPEICLVLPGEIKSFVNNSTYFIKIQSICKPLCKSHLQISS